jgi:hypothetical protein
VSYRCRNSRDPLERHKVKVAHAQGPRREGECGRLDVGVHGAMHVDRRAPRPRIARRDGEIFGVSRTPSETMSALGERSPAERRLAAL